MNTAIIPSVNIMTAGVIVFVSLFLPFIITSVCLAGKFINAKAYFCGFGLFFISELLFRAPLISALLTDNSFKNFSSTVVGMAVVGGLSAGFIEEIIKYACADKFFKKDISYKTALSLGFGGLCCEMITVLGIDYIKNIVMMIVINSGTYSPAELNSIAGAEQVIAQLNSLTPVSMIFDLVARLSKSMFFLCSAVLIMKSVQQKNPLYWFIAVVLHTLFNCVLILIPNEYIANGIVFFMGFMFMMYTILSKDEFIIKKYKKRPSDKIPVKKDIRNTKENYYSQGQDIREIYKRNMDRK